MSDERALIRRVKQRDEGALAELIELKRQRVFRIALNIVGSEDDAKDISQLAFVRLWGSIQHFDESGRFDPWFFRIVVNLSLDHYRRVRRGHEITGADLDAIQGEPLPGAMPTVQDAAIHRADVRRVWSEAARRLSAAQRAVFSLREIEGMPAEEIARIMGIRASTVRNHLLQARRVLQEYLRRRYPEIARGR
ncbi:MAG: RNA polymerase sigma factor [Acidobacteria bacterium]|nr:RNA polymerase sigma factor [Acidobacteriota bacterium]